MVVTYVDCGGYKGKRVQTYKNQGQGFLLERQVKNMQYSLCQEAWNWREGEARRGEMTRVQCIECGRKDAIVKKVSEQKRRRILCPECRVGRKREWWNWREAAYPTEGKVQQDGMQTEVPKGTVREGSGQRDLRRIFKILREVWLNIGVENVNIYKGITVKVLLDSGTTGIFMDKKMVAKYGFRLQKLERLVVVRNVDGINNSAGAIMHQVEVNVYYKNHVERMQIDVYDLGKTDIILGILWLQAHNPEINWKTEVKIIRYLPLCRRNTKLKGKKEARKGKRVAILEEKKIVRWAVDNKKDWGREEEVEADHRKIEEMVSWKFLK